jgi:hypothetical protein
MADLKRLTAALKPFAMMDRPGDVDLGELAVSRGVASDATFLFSRHFREARLALGWSDDELARRI